MVLKPIAQKISDFFKKYRYVALIVIIGLLLMMLPSQIQGDQEPKAVLSTETEETLEEQLTEILSQIKGAGKVNVLLSIAAGEETLYETNREETTGSDSSKIKTETVTVTDSARNQNGLVRQKISPIYLGAIIVCQGADDPNVRLSIVDAVSKLTGLGANRISVLKMK